MTNVTVLPTFNIATAMADIRAASQYLDQALELGTHIRDLGMDNITPEEILKWSYEQAYSIDVEGMGVTIAMDMEELCHDFHNAELIPAILHILSKPYLTTVITTKEIGYALISILQNEEIDDNLPEFLEYLHALYPNDENLSKVVTYIDLFSYSTDNIFYFSLLELIEEIVLDLSNTIEMTDMDLVSNYTAYIRWRRDIARQAVEAMMDDSINESSKVIVEHILQRYDLDKLQIEVIERFSKIDREGYDLDLSEEDKSLIDIHHSLNQHHIEYYYDPQVDATILQGHMLGLISHHYIPYIANDHPHRDIIAHYFNFSKEEDLLSLFKEEVASMVEEGLDKGIFTAYHVEFINTYSAKLYNLLTKV